MKLRFSVPWKAFYLFFVVQIIAMCLWVPKNKSSIENQNIFSSRDTLGEEFNQLTREGKKLGLSEELKLTLGRALGEPPNGVVRGYWPKTAQETLPSRNGTTNHKAAKQAVTYPWSNISNPINPHDYDLVINEPNFCRNDSTNKTAVFLLVMILSSPSNFKQRDLQRKSCLSISQVYAKNIRAIFLLGDSRDDEVSSKVVNESAKHGDILQENFHDSYENLTLKTLMGMKWVSVYCPEAEFILKTDDDVFVSLVNIVQLLEKAPRKNYFTGYVYTGTKPIRNKKSKWFISEKQYPRTIFPPYCCGIGYILSRDLPPKIFQQSLNIPYIFLEDVFTGLCIENLKVAPKKNPGFFAFKQDYDYCIFKRANAVHVHKPSEILEYWKK